MFYEQQQRVEPAALRAMSYDWPSMPASALYRQMHADDPSRVHSVSWDAPLGLNSTTRAEGDYKAVVDVKGETCG